ncbi:MAG TPA: PP2C family protein-serine/threonine phosphatase [Mycobacteriales bacterium]|nr:PP2C family protein-serine/threonine phosphatase [Mycobacteriales bacterium]
MGISSDLGLPARGTAPAQWPIALALVALTAVITALGIGFGPSVGPPGLFALPMMLGGLFLDRRRLRGLLGVTAVCAGWLLLDAGVEEFRLGNLVLLVVVGVAGDRLAADRDELGVPGLGGGPMLLEVRSRLRRQSMLPPLPHGWRAEVSISSAGGAGFSGDFLVSHVEGDRLEMALVDVSGKGVDAGSRALLLSGALGGLLGAVPPERFLPAANSYLLRQHWDEGFATAVHVALDLRTGEFLLQSAGHPPAAHYRGGSGYWTTSAVEGSVLGVVPDEAWRAERGTLNRGDALLLFTDGIIEVSGRDLSVGIDKLLGEANRLVISTFEGGAQRLVGAVAPDAVDDRALVLVWRQ